LAGILDRAQRYVLSGPHTPAEAFRRSSNLRNLSGLFLIAFSALRSSTSSTRSSSSRYSSMPKMTAVGFPLRITISGSFLFRLAFIGIHPSFYESTIVMKFLQMISVPLGYERSKFTFNGRYLGTRPAGNRCQASVIDLFPVQLPIRNFGNDLLRERSREGKFERLN
jgi:hypothetical protein